MNTLDYETRTPSPPPPPNERPPRDVPRLILDAVIALCCVCVGPILVGLAALGPDDRAVNWVFVPVPIVMFVDEPAAAFPAAYAFAAVAVLVWINRRAVDVAAAVLSMLNAAAFVSLARGGMG